jgi:MFS family permease
MAIGAAAVIGKEKSVKKEGYSKYVILALVFVGWCLGNMDRMVMSFAVVPIGKEFNLSASVIGLVMSSFFLGYAIMQIPGGWLADKFGSRKVLLSIVFVWSIFTSLTGAAWSIMSMLVIRATFGLAEGSFAPASIKMLSQTFPKTENGRALSIFMTSSGLMTILVPILAGVMITTMGWRPMFYLIGSIGVILTVLFWIFLKPRYLTQEKPAALTSGAPHSIGALLKLPMMWNIIILSFAVYTLTWGLNTWLPSYLVRVRHLNLVSIGWLQIIPGIFMMVAMYLGGLALDKVKLGACKTLAVVGSACAAVLLYLMYTCLAVPLFVLYQTLVYFILGFLLSFLPAFLVKQVPAAVVGSASGIMNFGSQLAGLGTPLIIGILVDIFKGSFFAAFCYLIAFAIILIGAFLTLKPLKTAGQAAG